MTTARERAYAAVEAASFEMRDGDGASGVVYPSVAANAASDVWEPLLRELYEAYLNDHLFLPSLADRMREALG